MLRPGQACLTAPSPERQLAFLAHLQRLLSEGSFVSTYKFALLLALAEACIEQGDDSGDALRITKEELAIQFVRIYWRQTLPYAPFGRQEDLDLRPLKQNTGRQAHILEVITEARRAAGGSMAALRSDRKAWQQLLNKVGATIVAMPLWKLQKVGGETLAFLYAQPADPGRQPFIVLEPGMAYCFRRFHELVYELVTSAWIRFVRGVQDNARVLGEGHELGAFLFGSSREALDKFRPILLEVQDGACFYCKGSLKEPGAVDHFIPWSRYAVNLGHNFVLAHPRCNGSKSDRLAAVVHLERWCHRNDQHGVALGEAFQARQLPHDLKATWQIARWAYAQAESIQARSWVTGEHLVALPPTWRTFAGMTSLPA